MQKYLLHRIRSFGFALKGIKDLIKNHPNAQIHLLATLIVFIVGIWLKITTTEGCLLVLCIVLVLALEAMNSAVEYLADKISPEQDLLIGKAKDIAAGAVLIAAVGAAIVGCLIFLPKLWLAFAQ